MLNIGLDIWLCSPCKKLIIQHIKRGKIVDVIIVGASISGLSCAKFLCDRGFQVLVLEKATSIGSQIEENFQGFPYFEINKIDLEIPRQYPVYVINIWTPKKELVELHFKKPVLYLTRRGPNRDSFDNWLARQAEKSGAKIQLSSEVVSLLASGGQFFGVRTAAGDEFHSKFIIAADGATSAMRGLAGVDSLGVKGIAFGEKIRGADVKALAVHVFFTHNISPFGYAYIVGYPDGQYATSAVVSARPRYLRTSIRDCYSHFRQSVASLLANASSESSFTGRVTCGDGTQTMVKDNLIFIGEAGGFQDPAFGFGMGPCIRSAKLCCEVLDETFQQNDTAYVKSFSERAKNIFFHGEIRKRRRFRRHIVELLNDDDFSAVIKSFKGHEDTILDAMKGGDFSRLVTLLGWSIITRRPALIRLVPKILFHRSKN